MNRLDRIEASIEALFKAQLKTDAQIAKTDAQLAKTDAQLAKTDAQLAKTDAQLAKTDAQLAKTDTKLKETSIILGNLGINLGIVAEEYFYNALKETKKIGKYKFDDVDLNVNGRNKKVQDEFDIVMYNGNTIAIIEVKHKVHPEDIQKLKTKKLENFKYLFPHYASYNYILGLGGFSLPKDIVELADKEGIAVFQKRGETTLINEENLQVF